MDRDIESDGDGDNSVAELMPLMYKELRSLAARYLRNERPGHTLQPTALIHEAFLKLLRTPAGGSPDPARFFGIAARAMRQVLVDHSRARSAEKRGGGAMRLAVVDAAAPGSDVDVLELDEALERLALLDERQARVVELRFFAGLSVDEAARSLAVSKRTVELDWSLARAFLHRELGRETA